MCKQYRKQQQQQNASVNYHALFKVSVKIINVEVISSVQGYSFQTNIHT